MVEAHVDYNEKAAHEYINELSARELILDYHVREEIISELDTRDLISELENRHQRRAKPLAKPPGLKPIKVPGKKGGMGGNLVSKTKYKCPYCSSEYDTVEEATDCSKWCKAK